MDFARKIYRKERSYLKMLTPESKLLVKSIALFNAILPLLGIFLTVFLFRQTQSQTLVSIFYIFLFSGIVVGFYINGFLLKKYPSRILMVFGLITEALVFTYLIFFPGSSLFYVCFFGLLYGITVGLYWANRNFLTLITNQSQNRIYFSSLESISKSISDIVTPLFIGGFLTAIAALTLLTNHDGYKILSIIMLFVTSLASVAAWRIKTPMQKVSLLLKNENKNWNIFRFYNFALGFLTIGTILIPPLMIIRLVGEEGALGTFQSIAALISASAVYGIAKSMKVKNRFRLITTSTVIALSGIAIYSSTYSALGVFAFMTSIALAQPFWWAYMSSLSYDLIGGQGISQHYAGLCDREIYINSGRVASILFFILLIFFFSDDVALRFVPLAYALFQIIVLFTARKIEKTKNEI